jgi:hypothetical protein
MTEYMRCKGCLEGIAGETGYCQACQGEIDSEAELLVDQWYDDWYADMVETMYRAEHPGDELPGSPPSITWDDIPF